MSHSRFDVVVTTAIVLGALAITSAPAAAQKGVLGYGADPREGIVSPDGGSRYTAINTFAAGEAFRTVLLRLATDSGRIERLRYLRRNLVVPAVADDGTPAGLSADGHTLVLSQPGLRFPQRTSRFQTFATTSLRPMQTVELDGTWTFDAISPNGRWMYLVEYTSPRRLTEYRVRRYDLEAGKLDPKPIIDPNESGEQMYGSAITRATSADGRFAYTLYDSAERGHPAFIHALDTKRGTAACIDLDQLAGYTDLYRFDLGVTPDGGALTVSDRGQPLLTVDTDTYEVEAVTIDEATGPAADDAAAEAGGPPWALAAGAFGLTLLAGIAIVRRGRRRHRPVKLPPDPLPDLDGLETPAGAPGSVDGAKAPEAREAGAPR